MNELREIIKRNSHPLVLDKYVDALECQIREWAKGKVPEEKERVTKTEMNPTLYRDGFNNCRIRMLKNLEEK